MYGNNDYMTQEEKDKIIEMYLNGFNTVQIGKELGRHNASVGRFIRKQGYKNNKTGKKLSDEDISMIKELYISGLTSREIYGMFCNKIQCEETIQVIIRNANLSRPRGHRNLFCDDYFHDINTSTKAYFLGLLLTDGNVHKPKRTNRQYVIQIGLKLEDKYILKKLKMELNSDNKIIEYIKDNRNECYFSVSSNKMAEDLSKYKIVPNKTFLIDGMPSIKKEFYPDLIRGIFDGDGTVYILKSNNKLRFGFYGTHKLIEDIINKLNIEINIPLNKITDKDTVSFITFGAKKDILNFYNYIYYSKDVICLTRKRKKFEQILF